jgi:hypothetical protein
MKRWEVRGNYIMRCIISLLFSKYNWNDQVKEDEMVRACSMNRGEKECIQDIGGKARRKKTSGKNKT